jgi:hypothetical protein
MWENSFEMFLMSSLKDGIASTVKIIVHFDDFAGVSQMQLQLRKQW